MSKNDYSKRAQKGWNYGKFAKKGSNKAERQFEKAEIRAEIHELEEGDLFRYPKKPPQKQHSKKKIKAMAIESHEKSIRKFISFGGLLNDWGWRYIESLKQKLKKLKERL